MVSPTVNPVSPSGLVLAEAGYGDLQELTTIFPRSFHPTSAFMREAIPDTPLVSQWWEETHRFSLGDPNIRIMKVVDREQNILGIARWRLPGPIEKDRGAGTWQMVPLSADHDKELCNGFIDFCAGARVDTMQGRPHYCLELLGTVHEARGKGTGSLLVQWGCAQADAEGVEAFVQSNRSAVSFYEKFGYQLKSVKDMPGRHGYTEFIFVRPPKKA